MSPERRAGTGTVGRACVVALLMALLLPAGPPSALAHQGTANRHGSLPPPSAWDAPGEPYLLPKRAAADWAERVGSWTAGTAKQPPPELWATAPAARTTVVGVQVADTWPQERSTIVTARQTLEEPFGVTVRDIAVRVDLVEDDAGTWVVVPSPTPALTPAPPGTAAPTPAARQVLDNDRIVLSGPARSDVVAGRVDDQLLQLLTALACHQEIEVSLLTSGYASYPSKRLKDDPATQHASGRAADIRRIAGEPVTSEHVEGAYEVMRAARERGVFATGPILMDDQSSSPLVPDHVHLAVR